MERFAVSVCRTPKGQRRRSQSLNRTRLYEMNPF